MYVYAVNWMSQQSCDQVQTRYYVTEKPTSTIEDEDMVISIQMHLRRFLAQRRLQALQHLERRERRRAALEAQWNESKQERQQFLSLELQVFVRSNVISTTWVDARAKLEPAKYTAVSSIQRSDKIAATLAKEWPTKVEAIPEQDEGRVQVPTCTHSIARCPCGCLSCQCAYDT